MPVSFRRLRIAGFKSFAEPTSVDILPGLTGVVGPNGCGKSNVVEALRWAMGESSARNLRGGEMDDVIFAGTAGRASRNIAEVTLFLDETNGRAPPPFHEQNELEIIRRIERGSGSAYKINGKEVRARDVQTLFADLASGSRASAMVSQGRVSTLVGARPEDRRAVLEEAANITGLHARRHEAELKLRAAEANLARAEDLRAQLESQLGNLKRQARQASRYRTISGTIRAAEADLLSVQRARAERDRDRAAAALHDAELAVSAATEAATTATARAADATAALPPLRETEANARTVLERHRVSQEQIAGEEQRARTALAEAQRRIAQIGQDTGHAGQLQRDAAAADQRLAAEEAELAEAELGSRRTCRGRASRCGRRRRCSARRGSGRQPRHRSRGRGQRPRPGGDPASGAGGTAVQPTECAVPDVDRGPRTRRRSAGRSSRPRPRHGRIRRGGGRVGVRPGGVGAGGTGACVDGYGASIGPGCAGDCRTRRGHGWRPSRRRWPRCWR